MKEFLGGVKLAMLCCLYFLLQACVGWFHVLLFHLFSLFVQHIVVGENTFSSYIYFE
jgi:hypothetical protein